MGLDSHTTQALKIKCQFKTKYRNTYINYYYNLKKIIVKWFSFLLSFLGQKWYKMFR